MGNGEGEGPINREGEPGAETRGPRVPGRLNAELLGGPRLELRLIEARLEFKFVKLSTCFVANNCERENSYISECIVIISNIVNNRMDRN
jgi:hypothetical protein